MSIIRTKFRKALVVTVLVLVCIGGILCLSAKKTSIVKFPPRPRLVYSSDELELLKCSTDKKKERRQIIARADAILKKTIEIPKNPKGGQWGFYYACSKDGARLKAISKNKHKCPKCGKIDKSDRINAAYRTILYSRADGQIYNLALAYAVTGDEKYVIPVRKAFLEFVDLYPKLQRHDRWGRTGLLAVVGGKRFCQHLSEAVSIIKLAKAYDLCANSRLFSEIDRKRIEKDFLEATVNEIATYELFVGRKNNHQTWFNAAYANVGVATGNKKLVNRAIHGSGGLLTQLQGSVTDDGIWYEGTVSYHFYALSAIVETLKALQKVNLDFSENTRLKSLWLGPLNLTFPDGRMPAINDGDPYDIKKGKKIYQFALKYFKDRVFADLAGEDANSSTSPSSGGGIGFVLKSCDLSDIGLAVLRRGSGKNAVCCFLDYGRHGDHHGHPDKLQIMFYALGHEMFLDPGRISYSVKEYNAWCRTTVAHNTVVLNKTNQKPARGSLVFFKDDKDFTACLAKCDNAYSGVNMRRFILLTDTFMIDVFSVSKSKGLWGNNVTWDWLLHCRGIMTTSMPSSTRKDPLGGGNGYQYLKNLNILNGHPPMPTFDFTWADKRFLRVYFPGETGNAYFGTGTGVRVNEKVPFVLRRRDHLREMFISVYDFSGDGSSVKDIRLTEVLGSNGNKKADAVGIIFKDTTGHEIQIGIDMSDDTPGKWLTLMGTRFKRFHFFIR